MKEQIINTFKTKFVINASGKIKSITNNRYLTIDDVITDIYTSYSKLGIPVNMQEVSNVINELVKNTQNNTQDITVEDFVKSYLIKNKNKHWVWNSAMTELEYCFKTNGPTAPADIDQLLNCIKAENVRIGNIYKDTDIKTILTDIQFNAQHNALEETINKIKYDSKYETYCNDFLKGIYDYLKPTESFEIFSTLMKHWAWQVKRKFNNKSVIYHIWLNFMGGTSLGKSTMIDKICAPMADFKTRTPIAKLFDDTKEIKRLTEKYILNFDELAVNNPDGGDGGLTADQLAMLKSIITGDNINSNNN